MPSPNQNFFTRHKKLIVILAILLLIAAVLTWYRWPRPLLSGKLLREAQDEVRTTFHVFQYVDGKAVEVTDRIDRAAVTELLSKTRAVRHYSTADGVEAKYIRYTIDYGIGLGIRVGEPVLPYFAMNYAYLTSSGWLSPMWKLLDYEEVIALLDNMLAQN